MLGQPAAAPRLTRLVEDRIEPGSKYRLTCTPEASRFAELDEQVTGQDRPTP